MSLHKNIFEKNAASVLIVAKPGRIRNSLRALLKAMPQITIVGQVDDGPAAVEMFTKHHPALIVLGSNLPPDQVQNTLKQIKTQQPQTRCIILTDTLEQQRQAKLTGADSVLLAGFSASTLFSTVEELLSHNNLTIDQKEAVNGN